MVELVIVVIKKLKLLGSKKYDKLYSLYLHIGLIVINVLKNPLHEMNVYFLKDQARTTANHRYLKALIKRTSKPKK